MRPHQAVGFTLINSSAVTNITTSARIWHGTRPQASSASALPCINFYEVSNNRQNGIESQSFSINCRAVTADTAIVLANKVVDLFCGSSGTGIYGDAGTAGNPFSIARASLRNIGGLIPEPDSVCYNVPVDIMLVYGADAVT